MNAGPLTARVLRLEAKLPPPTDENRVIVIGLEDPAGPEHLAIIKVKAVNWPK